MAARRSMRIWAIYLVVLGSYLTIAPNVVLSAAGFPPAQDIWIRVVGLLMLELAYFSWRAGRHDDRAFMRWSIFARTLMLPACMAMVGYGVAEVKFLVFGMVELAGGAMTWFGLVQDEGG